jgi:hypothetical protein
MFRTEKSNEEEHKEKKEGRRQKRKRIRIEGGRNWLNVLSNGVPWCHLS